MRGPRETAQALDPPWGRISTFHAIVASRGCFEQVGAASVAAAWVVAKEDLLGSSMSQSL